MINFREPYNEGAESFAPPAYRIDYYMTQRDYTRAMRAIDVMWMPSNVSNFTFMRNKLNNSLIGHCCMTKIQG
jgi:hypothetical protein